MKVMNYTDFMTKSFHPLLVTSNLEALDTLTPLSLKQWARWVGPSDPVCSIQRELDAIEWCAANSSARKLAEMAGIGGSQAGLRIGGGVFWPEKHDYEREIKKVAETLPPPDWSKLVVVQITPDVLYAKTGGRRFYGGGGSIVPDVPSTIERDEVADLRQEVATLKQQVAVLTGLVNLRAERVSDPLASAKSRGTLYKQNELASPDNLNLDDASKYAKRSGRVLNMERNKGWLYALLPDGSTRGFRYPKWQFEVPAERLRSVLGVLAPSSQSCWALHNFLTRPHADLDGKSPADALADEVFAIERIVDLARRRIDTQQGAS